jgi:AraC-like DNA-binding protein
MSILRHTDPPSILVRSFGVTFGQGQKAPPRQIVPPSAGQWHQLVYATRGVMTVRTEHSAWLVPPHRGLWVPAGLRYRVEMTGTVAIRMLYIRPGRSAAFTRALPDCTVVNVRPLLRELIVRTCQLGALDTKVAEQRRLIGVIFDELKSLTVVPLQLPLPRDGPAARLAGMAESNPRPLAEMLRCSGASRRTMERLFREQTAMPLGRWLRRRKVLEGLRRMAAGEAVGTVALDLGYNSASAFIAMFRRELGETPLRYLEGI